MNRLGNFLAAAALTLPLFGCYNPDLSSGKFRCDNSARSCPDGQVCLPFANQGLFCVKPQECWQTMLDCQRTCRDSACSAICRNMAVNVQSTRIAFSVFAGCIEQQCQGTAQGSSSCGPEADDLSCITCIQDVSAAGGACAAQAKTCLTN